MHANTLTAVIAVQFRPTTKFPRFSCIGVKPMSFYAKGHFTQRSMNLNPTSKNSHQEEIFEKRNIKISQYP